MEMQSCTPQWAVLIAPLNTHQFRLLKMNSWRFIKWHNLVENYCHDVWPIFDFKNCFNVNISTNIHTITRVHTCTHSAPSISIIVIIICIEFIACENPCNKAFRLPIHVFQDGQSRSRYFHFVFCVRLEISWRTECGRYENGPEKHASTISFYQISRPRVYHDKRNLLLIWSWRAGKRESRLNGAWWSNYLSRNFDSAIATSMTSSTTFTFKTSFTKYTRRFKILQAGEKEKEYTIKTNVSTVIWIMMNFETSLGYQIIHWQFGDNFIL